MSRRRTHQRHDEEKTKATRLRNQSQATRTMTPNQSPITSSPIKAKRQEPRHQSNPHLDLRRNGKMEKEKGERKDETGKRRNQRRKKASLRQGTAGSNHCVPLVDHPDGVVAENDAPSREPLHDVSVPGHPGLRNLQGEALIGERGASYWPIDFSLIRVNRTMRPFGLSNLLSESDMMTDGRVRSRYCLESSRVSYLST